MFSPQDTKVAFFSAEIGLKPEIPTYSGGLGILSGDYAKSCADLGIPAVFVTLMYHHGYFKQHLVDGWQGENPAVWEPDKAGLRLLPQKVELSINDRTIKVGVWEYTVQGEKGDVKVLFLDSNVDGNSDWDKGLTYNLYDTGGDNKDYYRLCQEMVLGIGGTRVLSALGYSGIDTYHMNDGHSALLTFELLSQGFSEDFVRDHCWFTTHTPVSAGFDSFSVDNLKAAFGDVNWTLLKQYGFVGERLSLAHLATNLSRGVNAVSRKHLAVCKEMDIFLGKDLSYITNGVHLPTWVSAGMARVYDEYIPGWRQDPSVFARVDCIPFDAIIDAKVNDRHKLVDLVRLREAENARLVQVALATNGGTRYSGVNPAALAGSVDGFGAYYDSNLPVVAFARRAEEYKRNALLLHDIEWLSSFAKGNFSIIFSGKAHPSSFEGKRIIQEIYGGIEALRKRGVSAAYIPDYDMGVGKLLVSAASVWVNTPERGREASGTSGMKAAANGALNISTLDGWWAEAFIRGKNGFAIAPWNSRNFRGTDADHMYALMQYDALPLFSRRKSLERMMKNSIRLAGWFNSHRAVLEYAAGPWRLAAPSDISKLEALVA